jgi:hypothetical protein
MGTGGSSPQVTRPGCQGSHLRPSSAEVKNERSDASAHSMPPWRIVGLHFLPSLLQLYYSVVFNVPFCCFATFKYFSTDAE